MKKEFLKLSMVVMLAVGFTTQSCKNKNKEGNSTNTTTTTPDNNTTSDPVTVSGDDEIRKGVQDATKDFPGVTATVNNGEVTLTGEITRDRLPTLMQSLNALQPKKINNNLTIK